MTERQRTPLEATVDSEESHLKGIVDSIGRRAVEMGFDQEVRVQALLLVTASGSGP